MRDPLPVFSRFAQAEIVSGDIDSSYPVLKYQCRHVGNAPWLLVLFMSCMDIGTTWDWYLATRGTAQMLTDEQLKRPVAVLRRGNRDPEKLRRNLGGWLDLRDDVGRFEGWLAYLKNECDELTPEAGWDRLRRECEVIWGNGRYASYKFAELIQVCFSWNVTAPDMGNRDSSGPRKGLDDLFGGDHSSNSDASIEWADEKGLYLQAVLTEDLQRPIRLEQVETILCDYHALVQGRYYVGYDIDDDLEQLLRSEDREDPYWQLPWAGRAYAFGRGYLGEIGGWTGKSAALAAEYRDTGVIGDRVRV